jgi:DNA polymerase III epsilon subunit-like protein
MSSSDPPLVPVTRQPPQPRKCGACGALGHNRRTCPLGRTETAAQVVAAAQTHQNVVNANQPPPPFFLTDVPSPSIINLERALYLVFDLETTGLKRSKDQIIEIAGAFLDNFGIPIEDAYFDHFIKPTIPIPTQATQVTGITNEMVKNAEAFPVVAEAFLRFISDAANERHPAVHHVILVGHNARSFDR